MMCSLAWLTVSETERCEGYSNTRA